MACRRPIEEVKLRMALREHVSLQLQHKSQVEAAALDTKMSMNYAQIRELLFAEASAREEIELQLRLAYEAEKGRLDLIKDREHKKLQSKRSAARRCDNKFGAIASAVTSADKTQEEMDLERGRAAMAEERQRAAEEAKKRDEGVRRRRQQLESFMAAKAFIEGEQQRQRQQLAAEEGKAFHHVFVDSMAEEKVKAQLRERQNAAAAAEAEGRRIEDEAAAAAAQAEKLRKAAAFEKEQRRMKAKCKHNSGMSLFRGANLTGAMCRICGVRYDAEKGYLVRM